MRLIALRYDTLEKVAAYTEKEFRQLHGVGPQNIPILRSLRHYFLLLLALLRQNRFDRILIRY